MTNISDKLSTWKPKPTSKLEEFEIAKETISADFMNYHKERINDLIEKNLSKTSALLKTIDDIQQRN